MSTPTIHARSEWTSRAARSVTRLSWPSIRVVDIHWPARAGMIPRDLGSIKRALVSWQRYHMDTQGWRDIAYNVAVDLNGDVWELRGWGVQDGGVAGRSDDVTILLIMGDKDTMTDAMKRSVLWAMGEFERRKGGALRRSYHGALSSTSCPGPEATRWARAGFPPPAITTQTPTITTKEDDMPTPTEIAAALLDAEVPREGLADLWPAAEGEPTTLRKVLAWSDAQVLGAQRRTEAVEAKVEVLQAAVAALAHGSDAAEAIRQAGEEAAAKIEAALPAEITYRREVQA